MNYGKAFRVIRAAFGLSQSQLADLLKLGQSHVSLIESDKRLPSKSVVDSLAHSLTIPRELVLLLASEPRDLEARDPAAVEALARSLLTLLVSASDEAVKKPTPPFIENDPDK